MEVRAPHAGQVHASDEAIVLQDQVLEPLVVRPRGLGRGDRGGDALRAVELRIPRVDPALEVHAVFQLEVQQRDGVAGRHGPDAQRGQAAQATDPKRPAFACSTS